MNRSPTSAMRASFKIPPIRASVTSFQTNVWNGCYALGRAVYDVVTLAVTLAGKPLSYSLSRCYAICYALLRKREKRNKPLVTLGSSVTSKVDSIRFLKSPSKVGRAPSRERPAAGSPSPIGTRWPDRAEPGARPWLPALPRLLSRQRRLVVNRVVNPAAPTGTPVSPRVSAAPRQSARLYRPNSWHSPALRSPGCAVIEPRRRPGHTPPPHGLFVDGGWGTPAPENSTRSSYVAFWSAPEASRAAKLRNAQPALATSIFLNPL